MTLDISQINSGWLVILWFGVLGMCLGSFANVVCHRLPIIRKLGPYQDGVKLQELVNKHGKYNLSFPRSACPCCDSKISAFHNVPVLGWIMLRGKCAECGERISIRYPVIELLFGVVFAGYVAFEGVWLAGLMTLPMMLISYCLINIRLRNQNFYLPLVFLYALVMIAQVALTFFGFSSYAP